MKEKISKAAVPFAPSMVHSSTDRQVSVWQHKDDTSIYVDCMEQTIREVGLNTPPKFDIAPEKWWLEDYFPIGNVTFKGHVKLWEGKGFEDSWEVVARMEQQKELEPFNMEYLGDKYHTIKDIFSIKTRVFLINLSLFGIWSLFFGSRQLRGRP